MRPNERLFKPEYAAELFSVAKNDLVTARVLTQHADVRRETVLLHCQQAVEKALNAVLCRLQCPVPLTHEIAVLVDRLRDDPPPEGYSLQDLSPYASLMRYEEGKFELTEADVSHMISVAEKVFAWAEVRMK